MTLEEIQAAFDLTETNKLSMALLFDVKGPAETAGIDPKAWPHVYYSPLRPFSGIAYIFKQLGLTDDTAAALNVVHRGNKLGILFTKVLLPVDRVRDFDLQLDRMKAYLPMLREYAAEHPMVAFRDSRENAYLLFHNPRGIWQLSRFVPELGPVGHEEGQTPEPLLKEAMFYRPDDGLYIEDIMATAPALSGLDDVRITGVEYQPDIIQAELPSIVERLNAAGYDGDFEILGAGMTSVVLLDQASQRAFKVARHLPVDLNAISDEYDFLVSLRNTVAAPYLPEAFSFDIHAGVLVREGVSGRAGGWGTRGLREAYDIIVKAARVAGWSHPEFKENSFIVREDKSIVMVDVGFAQRIGQRLVAFISDILDRGVALSAAEVRDFAFALRMDAADGLISNKTAEQLQARLGV